MSTKRGLEKISWFLSEHRWGKHLVGVLILGLVIVNFFLFATVTRNRTNELWIPIKGESSYLVDQSLRKQLLEMAARPGFELFKEISNGSSVCLVTAEPTCLVTLTEAQILSGQVESLTLRPLIARLSAGDQLKANLLFRIWMELVGRKSLSRSGQNWLPMNPTASLDAEPEHFSNSLELVASQSVQRLGLRAKLRALRSFQSISDSLLIHPLNSNSTLAEMHSWWLQQSDEILAKLGVSEFKQEILKQFVDVDYENIPLVVGDFSVENKRLPYFWRVSAGAETRLMPANFRVHLPTKSRWLVTDRWTEDFAKFEKVLWIGEKIDISVYVQNPADNFRALAADYPQVYLLELRGQGLRELEKFGIRIEPTDWQAIALGNFRSLEFRGQPITAKWNARLKAYRVSGVVDIVSWVRPRTRDAEFYRQLGI